MVQDSSEKLKPPTLAEATDRYLAALAQRSSDIAIQELRNFVRWFGQSRTLDDITAPDIDTFAEHIAASTSEPQKKLEPIKAFLSYAYKQKWCKTNLAQHLRVTKKTSSRTPSREKRQATAPTKLTREGFEELQNELKRLIAERPKIAEELEKARADRDFRENAPLDAAREHQAQVEARIRELESILKAATIIDSTPQSTFKVSMGDTVVIQDISSGEEMCYTLVSSREANPAKGKISTASPTGKCLLGRSEGETIEVMAPAGKVCYRILKVVHNTHLGTTQSN